MEKKRVGVLVAIELDAVISKYGTPKETVKCSAYDVFVYDNDAFTMYVLNSGAGEIAAAAGTQLLISVFKADIILNFGVVGALTEDVATAECCVVEKLIHYDFDSTGWLDLKCGQYPGFDEEFLYTDKRLVELAVKSCPELRKVTCASADKFIAKAEDKLALHNSYGADICEMESAGVLLTCLRNDVPCLLIKAVSDSLTGSSKEFFTELQRVSEICFAAADKVIREICA